MPNSNNSSSGIELLLREKTPSPSRKLSHTHHHKVGHPKCKNHARHSCYYDVVILGSTNVGKSTLAQTFQADGLNSATTPGGTSLGCSSSSGSDQGIGSEEEEEELVLEDERGSKSELLAVEDDEMDIEMEDDDDNNDDDDDGMN